jgi:hypothetical protein
VLHLMTIAEKTDVSRNPFERIFAALIDPARGERHHAPPPPRPLCRRLVALRHHRQGQPRSSFPIDEGDFRDRLCRRFAVELEKQTNGCRLGTDARFLGLAPSQPTQAVT